ncbi:hypothetical protein GCM10011594_27970 [Nakamurella endophytica]|uniref:MgtC/SapB/SrpB/YhiD N-terminal domain-containing protein n=1 Tax=Nakamurella endophytica TaxID=1748367 RepID=A0A917T199_9ACTN|nr:MgtC/SapB family protein [Nakamurella endophytica]GGM06231.1 hypothetical protein GCM10011594_27970 [Nakamurella endophytica]
MTPDLVAAGGPHLVELAELLLAFVLSAVVGLERQLRGKNAGLRTQAIVGTSSALVLLVSKYGFGDVLVPGSVVLDPSRVAAQIVSGIGFLGAGLILTRRGTVHGLTTAAAVWETAAIGMAAGAGLPLLAVAVTVLHFVAVLGFGWLDRYLPGRPTDGTTVELVRDGGVDGGAGGGVADVLDRCAARGWTVLSVAIRPAGTGETPQDAPALATDAAGTAGLRAGLARGTAVAGTAGVRTPSGGAVGTAGTAGTAGTVVRLELCGPGAEGSVAVLGGMDGVRAARRLADPD